MLTDIHAQTRSGAQAYGSFKNERTPAHPPRFKPGDKVKAEGYRIDLVVQSHRVVDQGPGTDMHLYVVKDPVSGATSELEESRLRI